MKNLSSSLVTRTVAVAAAGLLAACTTNRYTNAVLRDRPNASTAYQVPTETLTGRPYGKNAVFIPANARFSLQLQAINPAWVHQGVTRSLKLDAADGSTIADADVAYLEGCDLWVLISVRTTDPSDPLEFSTKRVSKASVVKYNMRSFGIIPLDAGEMVPFALEGNSSYEVDITIYQVRDVFLKRLATEFYRNSPGLSGVIKDLGGAVGATFKSVVGDPLVKVFTKEYGTDLALERALLEFGATLQFRGQFSVLRTTREAVADQPETREYLLSDPVKKDYAANTGRDAAIQDLATYRASLDDAEKPISAFSRYDSFIAFSVTAVRSPNIVAEEKARREAADSSQASPRTLANALVAVEGSLQTIRLKVETARTVLQKAQGPDAVRAAQQALADAEREQQDALRTYTQLLGGSSQKQLLEVLSAKTL